MVYKKHVDFIDLRTGRRNIDTTMVTGATMIKTLARNTRKMRLYCDMIILINHPIQDPPKPPRDYSFCQDLTSDSP